MIRSVLKGKLRPSDIMDVDLTGRYFAGLLFWEAGHPLLSHNTRLYFNPYTLKLEFIAYDGSISYGLKINKLLQYAHMDELHYAHMAEFSKQVFSDPEIYQSFKKHVAILQEKIKKGYFRELQREADLYQAKLSLEFPLLPKVPLDLIKARSYNAYKKIMSDSYFLPKKPLEERLSAHNLSRIVTCYIVEEGGYQYVEFENILPIKAFVNTLELESKRNNKYVKSKLPVSLPIVLPPSEHGVAPQSIMVKINSFEDADNIIGTAVGENRTDISYFACEHYYTASATPQLQPMTVEQITNNFDFIHYDRS